jgi:DnaJ-class molecular chaperone
MKNRFKGQCHTCKVFVPAGEGEYEGGYIFCSESIGTSDVPESLRNTFNAWGFSCLNEFNRKAGTSFLNRFQARDAMRTEAQATAPTAEEIAVNKAASDLANKQIKAARRAELRKLKQDDVCPRCMGAGGSDAWHHTGWTCNRCHGTGKYAS